MEKYMEHEDVLERLVVRAVCMLLKTNEGIVVEDKQGDDKQYIVWRDETTLRVQEFDDTDEAYETAAMTESVKLPKSQIKEGTLLWMHDDTIN
jgi:hypothetical protein